jgi:Tol biopolymer transport system component/DNA-binding winged helix-turn-helix (wHTH) protein
MSATARRIRFGDCEFDQRSGELWRNGDSAVLPNQPFRILASLVRHPGSLVTRDELARELWPEGTFVDFEHSLNAAVRRLREAIGDSAAAPQFIETVPQRGYRFIAPVEESDSAATEETAASAAPPPLAAIEAIGALPSASLPITRSPRLLAATALVALMPVLLTFHGSQSRPLREDDAADHTLVRLTSAAGLNTEPALSPDGSLLAYASDRGGADFDIYMQPVDGGDPVQITDDGADDSEPSFAPDGAHIVFSRRGSGLYVVGTLGGAPRLIVRTPWARTPRFSPDGQFISYWTGFPPAVVPGGIRGAVGSLFIVPFDGRPPREVSTHLPSARYPIWSPDGKHLLFLGEEDADRKTNDWYVIATDGGMAVKTGAVPALRAAGLRTVFPIPATWSGSNDVVFATNGTDSSNVWQVRISPTTHRVDGRPERLTFGSAIERNPIAASSGRIVFASLVENVDIWRVPLDPVTGTARGAAERVTDDASNDRLRTVSSDGHTLFFLSSRTKRDEVWTRDLRSGREHQLTHTGVIDASASPDGSRLAFSTTDGGRHRIELADTADGTLSRLCEDCSAPAGWSPDGRRLLYRAGSPARLVEYDFTSKRQTTLLVQPAWSLERPRYTRDGHSITFHTARSPDVRRIYTAALTAPSGGDGAWVPVVMDHGCHPAWSSNGRLLYHFSFRDGEFCPWVQSVDPVTSRPIGAPRSVVHFHHPHLRAASGAAAFGDVQGGYLYMTLTESSGNIWMIDRKRQ